MPAGIVPRFMLDMWKLAFYLDYPNVKTDYIDAVPNIAGTVRLDVPELPAMVLLDPDLGQRGA